jgi:hypothetical protein
MSLLWTGTHSLTHLLTYSLTHLLTHSLTNRQADEIFLNSNKKSSFVELVTPDNLYRMMEYGYNYMKNEDESKRLFL